jgi:hypothetical protein
MSRLRSLIAFRNMLAEGQAHDVAIGGCEVMRFVRMRKSCHASECTGLDSSRFGTSGHRNGVSVEASYPRCVNALMI